MRIEHPIGEIIRIPIGIFRKGDLEWHYSDYEIIGVVKDLYSQGMKRKYIPPSYHKHIIGCNQLIIFKLFQEQKEMR